MDETYIRVRDKLTYLYRAVDRDGQTLDFILSERRDLAAARRFFKQATGTNGVPDRVVIDKSGANLAGLTVMNVILKFNGTGRFVTIRQVKYLNNILEQPSRGLQANPYRVTDHRFIKRITGPMMGFKAFHSAAATIAGIEVAHMIRKGQFDANGVTASSSLPSQQHNSVQPGPAFNLSGNLRKNQKNAFGRFGGYPQAYTSNS